MADRTTELQKQNYYTELQNYRTTELHNYITTEQQNYIELQNYRTGEGRTIENRTTERQNNRTIE
jgi:hypothetical protein